MKKPNFFIVGQTRSGTTTIMYLLKQHPDVFIIHTGSSKIPAIFGFHPIKISEEEYLRGFSEAKKEKMIGDKCTDYMMCPESAAKIKDFNPQAKIIINLRNPIDCMHSLHNLMVNSLVLEPINDFDEALKAEKQRMNEELKTPNKYNYNLFYRKNVRYFEQVQRYFDEFGRDNVLVRIFEDFVSKPEESFKEVCKFLEIDSNFKPSFDHRNSNRISRNKLVHKLVMKTNGTAIRGIINKIPGSRNFYNFINLPQADRNLINPETVKRLKVELKPEIDKLSDILEKDLSYWYKN